MRLDSTHLTSGRSPMKTVLVVGSKSNRPFHDSCDIQFAGKLDVIHAYSLEEAEEQFVDCMQINAIIVTPCINSDISDAAPLVSRMRERFGGPIIVFSQDGSHIKELMAAGANYGCLDDAAFLTLKLLNVA